MIREDDGIVPEFSRPILADSLAVSDRIHEIEANDEERAALAERFGILSRESLSATIRLRRLPGGDLVRLRGQLKAHVTQACVVSLEPVPEEIEEEFELIYGPKPDEESEEIVVDMEAMDPPEPIINNAIDIGEAVAEHLALALEPFPRAPGAEFTEPPEEPEEVLEAKPHPFAALASLKKK